MISLTSLPRFGHLILQAWSRGRRRVAVRQWEIERLETRTNLSTVAGANWETFVDNGSSSNRVDIVFLGDGYTQAEINSAYPEHIDSMLQHMFFESEDPFPRYQNFFNLTRIDVVSAESGVDDPESGIKRNTALNATYKFDGVTDRLASIKDSLADAFVSKLPFKADMKYVTLNSSKYGGAGGPYAVFAGNDPSSAEIALHEQGHSFANLGDEYFDPGKYSGPEPSEPNVTKSSTGKWDVWLGYNQPGIGVIGAYEGGYYAAKGIYRPSENSKMQSLGQPFDAIAREALIQRIYDYVNPIDASLGTGKTVGSTATLWADVVDPLVIQTQWSVDGQIVPGATGPYFVPADHGFGTGTHKVTLDAVDDTDWVRRGNGDLQEQRQWTVSAAVSTPGLVFSNTAQHIDLQEGGASAKFDLRLSAAPTQPVTITIPGSSEINVFPDVLEFTPDNWDTPRTLTVSARADDVVDGNDVGDIVYQINTTDAAYATLTLPRTRTTVRDTTGGAQPTVHPPQITNPRTFFISPDLTDGRFVGQLSTLTGGPGQTLQLEIVGGNTDDAFQIDSFTGLIAVLNSGALDIQTNPTFSLLVKVSVEEDPTLFSTAIITINLADAPVITVDAQPLTGVKRSKATPVDKTATFVADGAPDMNGAVLTISGHASDDDAVTTKDTLSISKDFGIRVSGKKLTFGNTVIGGIAGGKKGQPLFVTFNSSATAAIVQNVLRSVSFKSTDNGLGTREIQFQITNIGGMNTNAPKRQLQLVK